MQRRRSRPRPFQPTVTKRGTFDIRKVFLRRDTSRHQSRMCKRSVAKLSEAGTDTGRARLPAFLYASSVTLVARDLRGPLAESSEVFSVA
jgi:hypothetical protein